MTRILNFAIGLLVAFGLLVGTASAQEKGQILVVPHPGFQGVIVLESGTACSMPAGQELQVLEPLIPGTPDFLVVRVTKGPPTENRICGQYSGLMISRMQFSMAEDLKRQMDWWNKVKPK